MTSKSELEAIADRYRTAYLAHDPSQAPISSRVRFSENNVLMTFPDASWDTVSQEAGSALTISDPATGQVSAFTAVLQNDTPGFLGLRLKIARGEIVEIEHVVSTKRNLSGPPTPIGDIAAFVHDPDFDRALPEDLRGRREDLVAMADGYFATLENNTGEIRGCRFAADATRFENGMMFPEIERGFRLGRYRFNERVRRDHLLVDEERGVVMSRAFIDHKGVLDDYVLTDGTPMKSIFREPHSWCVLEMFKVKGGMITAVEAVFIASPYYARSPWGGACG
jgi:hypothetical protein